MFDLRKKKFLQHKRCCETEMQRTSIGHDSQFVNKPTNTRLQEIKPQHTNRNKLHICLKRKKQTLNLIVDSNRNFIFPNKFFVSHFEYCMFSLYLIDFICCKSNKLKSQNKSNHKLNSATIILPHQQPISNAIIHIFQ